MPNNPYPIFIPAVNLSQKPHADWSKVEAKEYLVWLKESLDSRIGGLFAFFEIEQIGSVQRDDLIRMGQLAANSLRNPEFSRIDADGNHSLTNYGYSLAADMGLLTAKSLMSIAPQSVKLEVMRKHKRDASYNLPVLAGFGNLSFDPVGGSVAEAFAILAEERGSDAWALAMDVWSSRIV